MSARRKAVPVRHSGVASPLPVTREALDWAGIAICRSLYRGGCACSGADKGVCRAMRRAAEDAAALLRPVKAPAPADRFDESEARLRLEGAGYLGWLRDTLFGG